MSGTAALRRATFFGAMLLALGSVQACNKSDTADDAPAATMANEVRVDEVRLGNSIGADNRVTNEASEFRPTETVYASVRTTGTAPSATLQAHWTFQDGQVVNDESRTISPNGAATTEFHVSKPSGWPTGRYKVEIMLNGQSAGSKDFEVK